MAKRIFFTKEQEEEIINLYKRYFLSKQKIAKRFNISQCVVDRVFRENKIKSHSQKDYRKIKYWSNNRIFFTEDQKNKIKKMYEEDLLSCSKIGEMMCCSEIPIRRVLKNLNIDLNINNRLKKIRDSGRYKYRMGKNHYLYGKAPHNKINFSRDNVDKIIKLYKKDYLSSQEIGKIFGVGSSAILRVLKEEGIKTDVSTRHKELHYMGRLVPHNKGKPFLAGEKNPMYGRTGKNNPQYKEIDTNKIKLLYSKGLGAKEIAEIFNVSDQLILERLKTLGVKRREDLYKTKRSLIADDGHLVKSSAELFIDNFLFHNHILHVYEKKIGFGNFKCDFYIPYANLYIEYWGLNEPRIKHYFEKTQKKLEIYKQLGLNLLSIYPKDNVSQKLAPLLEFSKNQSKLNEFVVIE